MTPPSLTRPALGVAAALCLALAGCGKTDPPKTADKGKDTPKPDPVLSVPNPGANPGQPATTAAPALVDPRGPVQTAAEQIVAGIRNNTLPTDRITPAFLQVIGKPIRSPGDPYSVRDAANWLELAAKNMGNIGLPTGYEVGPVAVFSGSLQPQGRGRYLMRLTKAGTDWKLDWFQASETSAAEPPKPAAAEAAVQDFAARAFLDSLTDQKVLNPFDRAPLTAAVLTDRYRASLAPPREQHEKEGYNYFRAQLGERILTLGGGATGYTVGAVGADGTAKGELTGPTKKAFTLKLVKGPAAGQWLIDDFTTP